MRSLNLDQLRALAQVVELGSFSAAARQLNLTQPAISLQIRELEQRFGVKLVERIGKQTHATAPGRDLIEHARQIFRDCETAELAMRRFQQGWVGRVRIGTSLTALTYDLPPVVRRLREEHPGIELLVSNMPTRDTIENLISNRIDFGLVTLPVDDANLRLTTLRPRQLMAILPADMPDIPDRVTPAFAAAQPLVLEHARGGVYLLAMRWLADQLPLPRTPMHIGTVEAMKRGVAMGLGMSLVPDIAVAEPPPGVVVRPLDPPVPCTMALAEHRGERDDKALAIVRQALLELRATPQDLAARPAAIAPTP
ncbi:MAG TPA: LysR family transcriptional regulator, partial [Vineibacter sp.]|nr:LysR family transcriptional regulator [Vineibacter sp.]